MKILSVNEALERGLLRKTTQGLAIDDIRNIIESEVGKELLKNISAPSIIVSDDEKRVLSTTITKEVKDFNYGYMEKRKFTCPRVYTSDNLPVLVGGISYSGQYPSYTTIVQDNENIDINDYKLHIKSAKGSMNDKARVNKETNEVEEVQKLEEPILLSFQNNILEVIGNNVELEENDKTHEVLPIINREAFLDYKYYIELPDGRKSDLTYGYISKPSLNTVCLDIIDKIDKIKIVGNINEKDIECGEYDGNVETVDTYHESKPREIEVLSDKEKKIEDLMKQDLELDEQIEEKENLLKQYKLENSKNEKESLQKE